jgi:hypothetical protein
LTEREVCTVKYQTDFSMPKTEVWYFTVQIEQARSIIGLLYGRTESVSICFSRELNRLSSVSLGNNIGYYFSSCSVSFVLIGEYIQYSPLINFRLIIPSNIHLQCLCGTKNEKKELFLFWLINATSQCEK